MDALDLARLQFALTTSFHFLFVALTLGLGPLVAYMQTRYVLSKKPVFERMTRYWGQIYVVNYALGIVTGLVMEFQFGLHWSGLTHVAGDVFGSSLALEALIAFFVESTFLGLWIFGWHRLPRLLHLGTFYVVVITAYASAFWIMVANAFLQNPVGHEMRDGVLRMTDFGALLGNSQLWLALLHIVSASLLLGGLFVAGLSARQFIRRTVEHEFFHRSMRIGMIVTAPAAFFTVSWGFGQLVGIEETQPAKTAAFVGDTAALARVEAAQAARFGGSGYTPPEWVAYPLEAMITIGMILLLATLVLTPLMIWRWSRRVRPALYLLVLLIPVPYIALICGWLAREVGRQPWVITDVLRVEDAVSNVGTGYIATSLVIFTTLFAVLAVVNYTLIGRMARNGPREEALLLGARAPDPEAESPRQPTLTV